MVMTAWDNSKDFVYELEPIDFHEIESVSRSEEILLRVIWDMKKGKC